jgi:hypothetical protein
VVFQIQIIGLYPSDFWAISTTFCVPWETLSRIFYDLSKVNFTTTYKQTHITFTRKKKQKKNKKSTVKNYLLHSILIEIFILSTHTIHNDDDDFFDCVHLPFDFRFARDWVNYKEIQNPDHGILLMQCFVMFTPCFVCMKMRRELFAKSNGSFVSLFQILFKYQQHHLRRKRLNE